MQKWTISRVREDDLGRLAERLALKVKAGDVLALSGDLGAGKTTFARAFIRAVLADGGAEIPSPTFSLVQTYDAARLTLAHLDLYRLSDAEETRELGTEDMLVTGALLIEWPERAPALLPPDRLEIRLEEGLSQDERIVSLMGHGSWAPRLLRVEAMSRFLDALPGWSTAEAHYLQGDASARAYARLSRTEQSSLTPVLSPRREGERQPENGRAILMDSPRMPDGPPIRDGLPYSRIAHLAEDVRPFVAIAEHLSRHGLSAPAILAADLEAGFLLIEDLGDRVFGRELEAGAPQEMLWRAGVEALVALAGVPLPHSLPLSDGTTYSVPRQDSGVLQIETELLLDWYYPWLTGKPISEDARGEFLTLWQEVFGAFQDSASGLVLRDYHSPNLIWLPEREGAAQAGIIDFQDALQGPFAYDVVSLLQDARLDVTPDLEARLLDYYIGRMAESGRGLDEARFRFDYAALGAQRNTKILGIFARLAKRDGKPGYLRHIPRIWGYLARDLAHPDLSGLESWYDRHLPRELRTRALEG